MFGKQIGSKVYLHGSGLYDVPVNMREDINNALDTLDSYERHIGGFPQGRSPVKDCIIKVDMKTRTVSFIETMGWNDLPEPIITRTFTIFDSGDVSVRNFDIEEKRPVYHHKWMFVPDSYTGFDIEESKARSEWWKNHPVFLMAKSRDPKIMSKIGKCGFWMKLTREMIEYDKEKKKTE